MADIKNINAGQAVVKLLAEDSQLKAALDTAQARLARFSSEAANLGSRIFIAGQGLGAPFLDSLNVFRAFDDTMRDVAAVTGASDSSFSMLSVFAFTDANIVANSWSVQFRDRADLPSEYDVTFFDRDREWNRFTVVARDAELDNEATAQNTQSVTLYACDRREVAQAFAEYAIRQNMVSRTYSWSGGIDAMPVEIGDIVSVKGELVRVTSVSVEEDFTRKYEGVEYVDARFA